MTCVMVITVNNLPRNQTLTSTDNCTMTWEECNDNFRTCNHDACNKAYPPADPNSTSWMTDWSLTRWGCNLIADTYADVVDSPLGKAPFNASTLDRCMCRCPDNTFDCGKYCMMKCEAINEDAVIPVHKGHAADYPPYSNGTIED